MPYPSYMEESIRKLEAGREKRLKEIVPRLTDEEKAPLLKEFHPDFIKKGMRKHTLSEQMNLESKENMQSVAMTLKLL